MEGPLLREFQNIRDRIVYTMPDSQKLTSAYRIFGDLADRRGRTLNMPNIRRIDSVPVLKKKAPWNGVYRPTGA